MSFVPTGTVYGTLLNFRGEWDAWAPKMSEPPYKAPPKAPAKKEEKDNKVLYVTAFKDPMREMDKLHSLYDTLMDARRQIGEDVVPFHRFAALVKDQVSKLRDTGSPEVAFRVAVKDGKVNFTVRGMKGTGEQ